MTRKKARFKAFGSLDCKANADMFMLGNAHFEALCPGTVIYVELLSSCYKALADYLTASVLRMAFMLIFVLHEKRKHNVTTLLPCTMFQKWAATSSVPPKPYSSQLVLGHETK